MSFALLFPGQGSQYINMCKNLYINNTDVKKIFKCASDVLDFDLWDMIENGNLKILTKSQNAQPAILVSSYVLYKEFYKRFETIPDVVVGHSLGEISALVCAESLNFESGVDFVRKRGMFMDTMLEKKVGFAGIVTDLKIEILEEILSEVNETGYVAITGYNSPNQFMIGGSKSVECLLDNKVSEYDGEYIPFRMIPMKANAPYHSKLMSDLKPELKKILDKIEFKTPKLSILSTVSSEIIKDKSEISELLLNQLVLPVKWNQVMKKISSQNIKDIIDVGPNKIMKNLVVENGEFNNILAFDDADDYDKINALLKNN